MAKPPRAAQRDCWLCVAHGLPPQASADAAAEANDSSGKEWDMRRQTITNLTIGSSLALALVLAVGSAVQAQPAAPAAGMPMMAAEMQEHCKTMMEHKKTMAAEVKAQDAALTEMVAKMNRAAGAEQMPLMAAVITQMAEQRVARNAHMAQMGDEMMQHMMQHMQMGKDSMSQCPMMKDMTDMKGMAGKKSLDGK